MDKEVKSDRCPCGSGKPWRRLYDARGIYVGRVCDDCEPALKSRFRTEIFTDSHYDIGDDTMGEDLE